jgi:hypothetical protein
MHPSVIGAFKLLLELGEDGVLTFQIDLSSLSEILSFLSIHMNRYIITIRSQSTQMEFDVLVENAPWYLSLVLNKRG